MLTEHDTNIVKEPDLFSVYLIDPPYRGVQSFHRLTPQHYENIIGPIPISEMDCKMPQCFFKIKRWCERRERISRKNSSYNGKFVKGDLIVMQKGSLIIGGFYTDHFPMGFFESDLYPLIKYRPTDTYGFMYVDNIYLNKNILKNVRELHARENIRS
jgi:hypothetical protein